MHEAFQFTNISNLSFLVNKTMMSNPTNNPQYSRTQTPKDQDNDDNNNNQTRKTATSTTRPQEQALKCPRCDSPNTKFCYYNNYSLSQPRHFCKTCRRYWTNGGALRNVPIGGGCRKNKKLKTTSSSRLSSDSKDSSSSDLTGFKFLHGLNPTMDFNLGGLSIPSPSIGLYNQFATFPSSVNVSNPSGIASSSGNSMLGFNNYPINGFSGAVQELGSGNSLNVNSNLASSIESLSSINQDLHWKLQQKRLGMIFGTGEVNDQKEIRSYNVSSSSSIGGVDYQSFQGVEKPQPILFQNLDISRPELARESDTAATTTTTEWLFGHASYGLNGSDINRNGSDWNGSVSDGLHHYNALP